MKKTHFKIERYEHKNYFIDIVHETEGSYGNYTAWLQHKNYGISSMMFGMREELDVFLDIVEANLDDYIKAYRNEYMDQ